MGVARYQFPKDLEEDSQSHCMLIRAMAPGSDQEVASVALFIPGASSGSNMIVGSRHEYAETKLSKVVGDAAGGMIGVGFNAVQTAGAMFGGAVINPKVEVLYRDTDLRTFDFTFIMAPTSQEESDSLKQIVKVLRKYSSPTLAAGAVSEPRQGYIANQWDYLTTGGIFQTPSEFIVHFLFKQGGAMTENLNIPKMGRCVLEGVEIMYNPNGEWSTFKDGNPLSAQLSLRFREMRVIDSRNIEQGY
jgi:hypothetical protein